MKIAAAYLRVSTERQDEYSLDSQLKLIREYASKNDLIVPDEFVFCDDGISGRSAEKRAEFQNMVAHAKSKEFEVILVWKFSRFARNQEESIVYKSMLHRLGVEVVSISEPLIEGPFGSLIERILEWMDEFYSIRLAGEVKRGMEEKVIRGEPVSIPAFGYDIKDKKYIPNPVEAPVVKRIFEEYLAGKGTSTIARELGREGIRTKHGHLPENRTIDYILENPVYIGKIRWNKERHGDYSRSGASTEGTIITDGNHEPIISRELWDAVQKKLSREKRGRRKYERREQPIEWMLKGLVRCDTCGATLCYTALSCPSMQCYKYAHGSCSVSHSLSIAKANRLVIAALENCAELGIFPLAPQTVQLNDGPDYAKLIKAEEAKLRRVQEAYEAGIDSLQEYAEKKGKISADIKALKKQASAAVSAAEARELNPLEYKQRVLSVLDIIKDESQSEKAKNEALKSIISYIVYEKPNNRLSIYFYT